MAGLFRANIRHLHEALEIPAAAQARPRLEIRAQEVADRRDRLQNRTALLSLLVSDSDRVSRSHIPAGHTYLDVYE